MMTAKLSCIEAAVVAAVNAKLSWPEFQLLVSWLAPDSGAYRNPEHRALDSELTATILLSFISGASSTELRHQVFQAWLALDKIELVLDISSQQRIKQWIR